MRSASERRHEEAKAKAKAEKVIRRRLRERGPTEAEIGKAASVHSADCSCAGCGNPRKHFGQPTMQERRADLDSGD